MTLVAYYEIGLRKWQEGVEDAHGNRTDGYADPVNYKVYSIAPGTSNEPFESGRSHVITGLTVLAPAGIPVESNDLVIVDDEEYTVEGEIANWNRGPFQWQPGIQINLRRVEG